jgi:hypothetical protein
MRLALLGIDDDSLQLARWAVQSGQHQLVVAYAAGSHAVELQVIAPVIRLSESWEELLLGSVADVLIVGRGGQQSSAKSGIDGREQRADLLRKLAQAAVPLIVVCPACEAIVGFEIEMIRRDLGGVIVPYIPGAWHPAIRQLAGMVALGGESAIGKVEQIALEREQTDRSRDVVLVQLARDIGLLRTFVGTVQAVSASGPVAAIGRDPMGPKPKDLPSLANLNVYFSGDEGLAARWSISPASGCPQARLTIIGQRGKAVLTVPDTGDWSLDVVGDQLETETFASHLDIEQVFGQLVFGQLVFGQLVQSALSEGLGEDSAWLAACRDQEAAEAVDRSLARGRTIELFNEEHSEEASFKGIMAMGGCFLLAAALGLVFFATIVESLRLPMRNWPVWRLWPIYLLVPISAFLLLQLLQVAFKRNDGQLRPLAGHTDSGRN